MLLGVVEVVLAKGEAHPHLVASLVQPFVIKFKLHSFQECFSWQTKSRIYDWNNSISD